MWALADRVGGTAGPVFPPFSSMQLYEFAAVLLTDRILTVMQLNACAILVTYQILTSVPTKLQASALCRPTWADTPG